MKTEVISQSDKQLTLQVSISLSGSMLEMEGEILSATNSAGLCATQYALKKFDTGGAPIVVNNVKLTSRGTQNKTYQSPYGKVAIERHIYQSAKGGKTFCPLELEARIINGATLRFAKMLSSKYGKMCAPEVIDDLEENHGLHVTLRYLQHVSEVVATIAQATEESWEYSTPALTEPVSTIGISLDGAYVLMHDTGYREAMVGSISLFDKNGDRQHSTYIGAAPEYGKAKFQSRLEKEIEQVKKIYPDAKYVGIADGAKSNWSFLNEHTDKQIIDFYHVTEYLSKVSEAAYPGKEEKASRKAWLKEKCHQLKHDIGSALTILDEIKLFNDKKKLRCEVRENLQATITYFENNHHMMKYSEHVDAHLPIGSGVTEAACKTLIKQRFCRSGMRWKDKGMKVVLSLRQLIRSGSRWNQFWDKINYYGVSVAA